MGLFNDGAAVHTIREKQFIDIIFGVQTALLRANQTSEQQKAIAEKLFPTTSALAVHFEQQVKEKLNNSTNTELIRKIHDMVDELKATCTDKAKEEVAKLLESGSNGVLEWTKQLLGLLVRGFRIEDELFIEGICRYISGTKKIVRASTQAATSKDVEKLKRAEKLTLDPFANLLKNRCETLLAKVSAARLLQYFELLVRTMGVMRAILDSKVATSDDAVLKNLQTSLEEQGVSAVRYLIQIFTWLHIFVDESDSEWRERDVSFAVIRNVLPYWRLNKFESTPCELAILKECIETIEKDIKYSPQFDHYQKHLSSEIKVSLEKLEAISGGKTTGLSSFEKVSLDESKIKAFAESVAEIEKELAKYNEEERLMHINKLSVKEGGEGSKSMGARFGGTAAADSAITDLKGDPKYEAILNSKQYLARKAEIEQLQSKIAGLTDKTDEESKVKLAKANADLNKLHNEIAVEIRTELTDYLIARSKDIRRASKSGSIKPDMGSKFEESLNKFTSMERSLACLGYNHLDTDVRDEQTRKLNELQRYGQQLVSSAAICKSLQDCSQESARIDQLKKESIAALINDCETFESTCETYATTYNKISSQMVAKFGARSKEMQSTLEKTAAQREEEERALKRKAEEERLKKEQESRKAKNIVSADQIKNSDKLDMNLELDKLPETGAIIDTARKLHSTTQNYESNNNPIIVVSKSVITHMVKAQHMLDTGDVKGLSSIAQTLVDLCNKLERECRQLAATPGLNKMHANDLKIYPSGAAGDAQQLRILVTLQGNEYFKAMAAGKSDSSMDNLIIVCTRLTNNVKRSLIQAENSSLDKFNKDYPFERRSFTTI